MRVFNIILFIPNIKLGFKNKDIKLFKMNERQPYLNIFFLIGLKHFLSNFCFGDSSDLLIFNENFLKI